MYAALSYVSETLWVSLGFSIAFDSVTEQFKTYIIEPAMFQVYTI